MKRKKTIIWASVIIAVISVGVIIWLKTKKFKKVKLPESSTGIYLYDNANNRTEGIERPSYVVIDTTKTYTGTYADYPFYGLRKAIYSDGQKVIYNPNETYICSIVFFD